ncbi:MAG: biotin--[acetyl-CoA-carboxylase] ligase, partial [Phycisphaerae bacterium]
MRISAFETLDSTNLEAQRQWRQMEGENNTEPVLITAGTQTGGLGRSGRSWLSPSGGLWMTLLWPVTGDLADYQAAPLIAGLATAEAIDAVCGVACQIKWPNDLLIQQRKLVGILCQGELGSPDATGKSNGAAIIIGIGINANFASADLGPGLRHPPISLRDLLGENRTINLIDLRDAVVQRLVAQLQILEAAESFATTLLPRIEQRLAWRGQTVRCSDTQGQVLATGQLAGLTSDGCIVIRTASGPQILAVGELQ